MSRKFICFVNPVSGTKNKEAIVKQVQNKISKAGFSIQIIPTNKEADYLFLAHKIKSENITDIIICGGDGSVSQVAAALQGIDVSIGIIPIGSGNGLARAAGISTNISKAVYIILKGNTNFVDAFYVNNHFSCMLAGLGMDAQIAADFSKQKTRGLGTYIQQGILNFFSASPFHFSININNKELNTEAFFISIANSNQFGNNVTIAPKASLSDGLLDIILVTRMNKAVMIYKVLKQIIAGKPIAFSQAEERKKEVLYFQAANLTIKNLSNAPLHLDGEPAETAKEFDIKIIEKAFRLLMP